MPKALKALDITDMRFGHLVAIKKAKTRNRKTFWRFRCDCGNEKEIRTTSVTSGIVKNCGCVQESRLSGLAIVPTAIDENERVCRICEKPFYGLVGDRRVFCYECAPGGMSPTDTYKNKCRAIKHILVEYKGGQCIECGYSKCEGALQFHHLNGEDKDFTLSSIHPNEVSMADLLQEVDKCVLLCANCHVQKHTVDNKIGFVMKLPPKSALVGEPKKCIVCSSEFVAHHYNRRYCYTCVPYGIGIHAEKRARKRAMKHELLKYKSLSCECCGYDENESALHFHHRDPNEKDFSFSRINLSHLGMTMDKLKAEADKCDVLCANCHAEMHYKNGGHEIDLD